MKAMSVCFMVGAGLFGGVVASVWSEPQQGPPPTPPEIVATYSSVADTILAAKKTEHDLVLAMLAGTYRHAEARVAQVTAKAGQPAKEDMEALAALVAQMGTEGDASIAAIRKRLLDGGFHHNSAGEQQGVFDEGYVIVTKEAKKAFLASAAAFGKMASAPVAAPAVASEWDKVKSTWTGLAKTAK